MIEVIYGTDWSNSKDHKVSTKLLEFVVPNNIEDQEKTNNKGVDDEKIEINPYEYFGTYSSLFGHSDNISPINLGVYLDKDWNIHSTQFVGMVPLINKKLIPLKYKDEQYVIKIDSRFHISPSMMLKEVLEGDDYYENPEMLQCKAYKLAELRELFRKGKKNKVLCGTIKDVGKITLKQSDTGEGENGKLDALLSSIYPIFEIIRFVNLAKEVCKKSLKQQSVYKEDNLVGKVKGRILINKQIKQNLSRGQYHKTYCAYNSLSDNIKENTILKYTLHLCSKLEIADSLREDIMFCNRVLSNVPLKKCNISDFVGLKSNGAFRQYKQTMDAAKAIIRKYYISYDQSVCNAEKKSKGKIKVTDYSVEPYFIDMNLLFEYYCRALFRKAVNQYNQEDKKYILKMDAATSKNKELFKENSVIRNYYMPTYIPDIVIRYQKKGEEDKILTVIDAKYSNVEHSGEKRSRTHQVLFYMNVLDSYYGGLISPSLSSDKPEESIYKIGNYLYDGKNESRQKLCYLPLVKENLVGNKTYDMMVRDYLVEIMDEKSKVCEEGQKQLEYQKMIKSLLGTIGKVVVGEKLSTNKEMKEDLLRFYNEYCDILGGR